jgi:hypothetical protein
MPKLLAQRGQHLGSAGVAKIAVERSSISTPVQQV